MMKKIMVFFALIVPTWIHAMSGFYVGAQGGGNFLNSQYLTNRHCFFDFGYNVGAVGGYAWCCGLRLEGEFTYHHNHYRLHGFDLSGDPETFHGKIDTWSYMANGYYDIPFCRFWRLSPYVGAGIGMDHVHQAIKMDGNNKGSHNGFAWQLMAGTNYRLVKNFTLSLEYKFHMAPLRSGHHLENNSFILGIKRFF